MRKKNILGNFVKKPNVLYSHTPIRKLAWEHEAYTTLITFLPECRELWVDCAGKEILLAAPGYKWLVYLPMGERWCVTAFYNPANELLEWYFDISRNNFIDEHGMPCIDDVFLDLVILPDGQAVTVDADELQEALDKGEITKLDFENAYIVHDQIKGSKWSDVDFLKEISSKLLLENELSDIPDFDTFAKIELLNKGFSGERKYRIETTNGTKLLLRISDIEILERKKIEYSMLKRAAALDINLSTPVDFGLCNNGKNVYQLLHWVDGVDLDTVLQDLPETEQYVLGLKAGEILRKIHTLPAPEDADTHSRLKPLTDCEDFCASARKCRRRVPEGTLGGADAAIVQKDRKQAMVLDGNEYEPWDTWFYRKVQERIDFYNKNPIKSENGDLVIRYLYEKKHLLVDRPQTFNHGDCNKTNLIAMPNGEIGVIDFDIYDNGKDHGDPWKEFIPINWIGDITPYFNTGMLKGYFDGEPPLGFFEVFAYYLAYDALDGLMQYIKNGEPEEGMLHMANIVCSLSNMQNTVPTWYLKDFYVQWTDGVPYKLKEPFDFSFLAKYGKVFKVFDDQDSGNICFGMVDGEEKRFVKFAGAPTKRSTVAQDEAIERMKSTIQIYKDLSHPVLANLLYSEEIGGGIACVFQWLDAECMGRQYPQSRERFLQISPEAKLQVFDDILLFHVLVVKQNYVAIDFYDGCIMYDFDKGRTAVCDIELYEKAPVTNNMGRMYGSSRFMSPEEFQLGATIDEITNVYTMGATAFALFGDERDRCFEKWTLSKGLFDVAKKAVSDERRDRQQSIEAFISEWRAAK